MEDRADGGEIERLKAQLDRWFFVPWDNARKTKEDVDAAEAAIGRRLPEDFRWFCLMHGGGAMHQEAVVKVAAEPDDPVEVGRDMIAFDRLGDEGSLERSRSVFCHPPHPEGAVPCASTIWGDYFFLRFDDGNDGSVWFWDDFYERHPTDGLLKAADSFTDLLVRSQSAIVHTDRLTLRTFEPNDDAALFEIMGSSTTMQLMPRRLLMHEADATSWIETQRAQQREIDYSIWAVVLRSSGRVIGTCGFRRGEQAGSFELGYVLDHNYWGQGYATEAATAAIDHILENHVVPRATSTIFATVRPNNDPSIAVARRVGMRQVESIHDEHGELLKFELNNQ